ncbi:putative inorganic phosphate cotransporter isoform X1 [Helicoverpa zea]|uniref:putative inorganic phosphate cotransporter isoform X1 n=1 Tax=Helicoverpa zea TaxID=7113 RepID=UPI001F578699|nr:putative inorganic phosphate cotransporter isoform X1 [Helicoverpa zea]
MLDTHLFSKLVTRCSLNPVSLSKQGESASEWTPLLKKSPNVPLSTRVFIIPQRWVMAIMGFLAVANAYTMRVCLNIAITQMVHRPAHSAGNDGSCPSPDLEQITGEATDPTELTGFNWDEATQGMILSAFYYGYIVTHLPGGMIAERFGGKYSLGFGVLSTAVFTLLTPWTVSAGGATGLIILRVLEGLGEGFTFPALNAMLARWAPISERGRMGSLVFGGAQIGNIAGTYLSGLVIKETGEWQSVFYLFGAIGILWFILWALLCYNDPESHPFISDKEKKYLEEALGSHRSSLPSAIPWKAIFMSVPLWALVCAQIGHDYGYFTMVTDLPKYMTGVLKFDIHRTGTLAALPYAVMWLSSIAFGWICDKIVKRNWLTVTNARKTFTTIASIGPGICMILASYSGCNTDAVVILFTASMGLMGAFYPGMKVNALDLSGKYAATIMAIVNGIGAITGIIAPYLVGLLTPDSTLVQWRLVFWIALAVFVLTNLVFVAWASGDEQWWNTTTQDPRKQREAEAGTIQTVNAEIKL